MREGACGGGGGWIHGGEGKRLARTTMEWRERGVAAAAEKKRANGGGAVETPATTMRNKERCVALFIFCFVFDLFISFFGFCCGYENRVTDHLESLDFFCMVNLSDFICSVTRVRGGCKSPSRQTPFIFIYSNMNALIRALKSIPVYTGIWDLLIIRPHDHIHYRFKSSELWWRERGAREIGMTRRGPIDGTRRRATVCVCGVAEPY